MKRKKVTRKKPYKFIVFCISLCLLIFFGPNIVDALGLSNTEYMLRIEQQENSLFEDPLDLNTVGTYSVKQSNPGNGNGNGNGGGNGGGNGKGNGKDKP